MSLWFNRIGSDKWNGHLIAGPCAYEGYDHACFMLDNILPICVDNRINLLYKTSFDKANRTSADSFRGAENALKDFGKIKKEFGIEICSDVHEPWQITGMDNVNVIQIPAFLCRQTDLLKAAAVSGRPVMVKKGQFLSPKDMKNVAKKLESFGCERIILAERGTMFGYNNLVVDFRSIPIMQETGHKVCIDATHSTQMPGGNGESSGGDSQYAKYMMRNGLICGADIVFAEVHNDPFDAPSDSETQLDIEEFKEFIGEIHETYALGRKFKETSTRSKTRSISF